MSDLYDDDIEIIADLKGEVIALKNNYISSREGCLAYTVANKKRSKINSRGWIIERVTIRMPKPNREYLSHPEYRIALGVHEQNKDRLVAVHRIKYLIETERRKFIGDERCDLMQRMWSTEDGLKWAKAIALDKTYDIIDVVCARDLFGKNPSGNYWYEVISKDFLPFQREHLEAIQTLRIKPRRETERQKQVLRQMDLSAGCTATSR